MSWGAFQTDGDEVAARPLPDHLLTLREYLTRHPGVRVGVVASTLGMRIRDVVVQARASGFGVRSCTSDCQVWARPDYVAAVRTLVGDAPTVAEAPLTARLGCSPNTTGRALRVLGYVPQRGRGARWHRRAS